MSRRLGEHRPRTMDRAEAPGRAPGGSMESVSRAIVRHAQQLAREVDARAVVVYADAMTGDDELGRLVQGVDFPTILVTRSRAEASPPGFPSHVWVSVPDVQMTR